MKENLQILNNILIILDQLEIKSSRQNSMIMYGIYANIDQLIKNLDENQKNDNQQQQPIKIIKEIKDEK